MFVHGQVDCQAAATAYSPGGLYSHTNQVIVQAVPGQSLCNMYATQHLPAFGGCVASTGDTFSEPSGIWSYVWHPRNLSNPGVEVNFGLIPWLTTPAPQFYKDEQEATLAIFADWKHPDRPSNWVQIVRSHIGQSMTLQVGGHGGGGPPVAVPIADGGFLKISYSVDFNGAGDYGTATNVQIIRDGNIIANWPIVPSVDPQFWDAKIYRCFLRFTFTHRSSYFNIDEPWTQFKCGPAVVFG